MSTNVHHRLEGGASRVARLERGVTRAQLGQVARFYNGGTPLDPAGALDLLLDRLTQAERTLAKVALALNSHGRRAA